MMVSFNGLRYSWVHNKCNPTIMYLLPINSCEAMFYMLVPFRNITNTRTKGYFINLSKII